MEEREDGRLTVVNHIDAHSLAQNLGERFQCNWGKNKCKYSL